MQKTIKTHDFAIWWKTRKNAKIAKNGFMEKRKNCGKTGRGAMGHYRALSKNTKNAKIVEKPAGALWGTIKKYETRKKREKRENAQIAKNGPGHYGTLWDTIKKKGKTQKLWKKALWSAITTQKNVKKCENEKTQFLQKCYFFSFFEKQRNDKRAKKLRFLRFSQIEKSYFSVGFGIFLDFYLENRKGAHSPKMAVLSYGSVFLGITPLKFNSSPPQWERIVFRLACFRGYVKLRGRIFWFVCFFLETLGVFCWLYCILFM